MDLGNSSGNNSVTGKYQGLKYETPSYRLIMVKGTPGIHVIEIRLQYS